MRNNTKGIIVTQELLIPTIFPKIVYPYTGIKREYIRNVFKGRGQTGLILLKKLYPKKSNPFRSTQTVSRFVVVPGKK
jgi:hypothetical protein